MRRSLLACTVALLVHDARAACSVSSSGISFGNYDVFASGPTQSAGSVVVSCTENPPTDVTLALGPSSSSGRIVPRWLRAASGADRLDYNLFIDPGYTTVWGDGIGGGQSIVVRKVNRNRPQTVRFYGRITAGQDVGIGSYSDSVTLTITP